MPSYTYEDLRDLSYQDEFFDAVVCISTLEHIGMDNTFLYTPDLKKKENDKYAYLEAVKELKRVIKKGRALYLTMPYGRYKNHGWFQVFDKEMVRRLVQQFAPSQMSEVYFKYEYHQWNYSHQEACQDGYYFDIHKQKGYNKISPAASESVICLELIK